MRARGFTLVEMLVTLVVTAIVSTLLWQALAQVARFEIRLRDQRELASRDMLRRAWIDRALSGVMSGPTGDPRAFRGDALGFEAYMTMPPSPVLHGPVWVRLRLQRNGDLTALRQADDEEPPLWAWPGEGHFDYMDAQGAWTSTWPPDEERAAALPRAIRLQGAPGGPLLVALPTRQNPMLRRIDLTSDALSR